MQKSKDKLKRAMRKRKRGVVDTVVKGYQSATKGMQNIGYQMAKNVAQGREDFKSGKMPYYGSTDVLKGTGKAFMSAFKAKRKLQRGMRGKKR